MYSFGQPTPQHLARLRALAPGLEIVPVTNEKQALDAVGPAEVILGHRYLRQSLGRAKLLKWVQSSAGSVDRLPIMDLARRGILLTRSTVDSREVAAHAIALAWSLTRALPQALMQQMKEKWDQQLPFAPMPKKAIVIGYGAVGEAIAERLRAQDIRVICSKRGTDRPDPPTPCEQILFDEQWLNYLAEVDWCFLALQHTPQTTRIFDEAALLSLPARAILVNVGRGQTLDTAALVNVLQEGHLAGVALDVTEPSPLPAGHPLWRAPRLLITPHVASHHPGRGERIERYIEQQVSNFLAGEALRDVVDMEAMIAESQVLDNGI
jgi:phosphoglycerate dehydrogenase-like enzyme